MMDRNAPGCEPPIFSAVLTPYRSSDTYDFWFFMALAGILTFSAGTVFAILGAWPVFGFLAVDLLLLFLAFRANYRAGLVYEVVTVTPSELTVRQVSPSGKVSEWSANPLWVRFHRVVHAEFGVQRLSLITRGNEFTIGSFLPPDEKASFGSALAAAIHEAKRGPARTLAQAG